MRKMCSGDAEFSPTNAVTSVAETLDTLRGNPLIDAPLVME
jgi:hypothetical protein